MKQNITLSKTYDRNGLLINMTANGVEMEIPEFYKKQPVIFYMFALDDKIECVIEETTMSQDEFKKYNYKPLD